MKTYYLVLIILLIFIFIGSCANLQYSAEISNEKESAADKCDCQNGFCKEEKGGNFSCVCLAEYGKYTNKICKKCDCGTGANCTWKKPLFTSQKTCLCKEGYKEINGICRASCRDNGDCHPFEICIISSPHGKFCSCRKGKSGESCEIITECVKGKYRYCKGNNGQCRYNEEKLDAECDCGTRKKWDERTQNCRSPCNDDCDNYGQCEGEVNARFCRCKIGTSGDHCKIVRDCSSFFNNICGNGRDVECVYDVSTGGAVCVCDDQSKLFFKESKKCTVTCKDNCSNNGVCQSVGGAKFCKCKPGTSGDLCETVTDCTRFGICGYSKGVNCVYDENKGGGTCKCDDPMKSFDRINKICAKNCSSNAECQPREKCSKSRSGDMFCGCKPGRSGVDCERIDDCLDRYRYCSGNNGQCVYNDEKESAECDCGVDRKWDVDKRSCRRNCSSNADCQPREKCSKSRSGDMFCGCKPGRSGESCEKIDDCLHRLRDCSGNNGQCVYNDEKESAECDCGVEKKWDADNRRCRIPCNRDCNGKGYCRKTANDFSFCQCYQRTRGDLCEISIDCDETKDFCGNKTDVKCKYGVSRSECICDDNNKLFDSTLKECRSPCYYNCHNKGRCTDWEKAKFCRCKPGTSGDFCETVDECTNEYCGIKDGVECIYDENKQGALCKCDNASKKFDTTIKECRIPCEDDCANRGVCEQGDAYKFCKCKPGTSGELCTVVDDCSNPDFCGDLVNVDCVYDGIKGGTCICHDGIFDAVTKKCLISCKDDCVNDGECEEVEKFKLCKCKPGTSGDRCEIVNDCSSMDFCGTNANVECVYDRTKKGGSCKCKDPMKHFDPKSKECRMDWCASNPCLNQGFCINRNDTYECKCTGIYGGKNCSKNIFCDLYGEDICGTEMCQYDDMTRRGYCVCKDGKIFNETSKTCTVDWCASNPCLNQGFCINRNDTYECKCTGIYGGKNCSKNIFCDLYGEDICGMEICQYDNITRRGHCVCKDGKIFNETSKTCTDRCFQNPCKNGGTCHILDGNIHCSCRLPYSGDFCEKVDWCASNPCLNQGYCINRNDTYECNCTGIYGGKNCSENIFCDLYGEDICGTEMCQYDDMTRRGYCVCKDGKIFNETSKTCTDRCFQNPCKNGGTCHILDGNIHCSCRLPYSGDFCEKGGCSTYPCLNGGICREESDALMCFCKIPFYGERCEKDPCSPSPCQNGATCSIDGTTYKCLCKSLYTGTNCETDYRYMITSVLILLLFALICLCRGCYVCRPTHNIIFQGEGYKTLPNMP